MRPSVAIEDAVNTFLISDASILERAIFDP